MVSDTTHQIGFSSRMIEKEKGTSQGDLDPHLSACHSPMIAFLFVLKGDYKNCLIQTDKYPHGKGALVNSEGINLV